MVKSVSRVRTRLRVCCGYDLRRVYTVAGASATRGLMSSSEVTPPSGSSEPRRTRSALSLEWKLPLLITAVLAAGLAAFLTLTYFTLARRSENVVRDRFAHASQLVARTIADAVA